MTLPIKSTRMARVMTALLCGGLLTAAAPNARADEKLPEVESVLSPTVGAISVKRLADGLVHPWGMDFLPDGRLLITERPGRLRIMNKDHKLSEPVEGVPKVFAEGQGGLLDVVVDPNFKETQFVYLSYAKPGPEGKAATALGRGKLVDDRIEGFEDLFVQEPWIDGSKHFGSRIVFSKDGRHLFLTLGERFKFDPAQSLATHLGTVVRLTRDGKVPEDNPFVGKENAKPEIWSYGHRNIQSGAIDPETGKLWIAEMGPLGGDELNQPEAGKNYGWPVVSWGMNYDGSPIPNPPTRPEFADAVKVWTPVISPNGMVFYTGDVFKAWRGMAIIGGLSAHDLVIVRIKDGKVTEEQRIPMPTRIRDVAQGPDGLLYILTGKEDGEAWRAEPLK